MRETKSHLIALISVGALSMACGSSKNDTVGANSGNGGGEDSGAPTVNPDGIPYCGTDPAKQPDRCIDDKDVLRCKTNTGYPGDELAVCDPDPDVGMLVHFGPKDYSDPAEMANYLLDAGDEKEFCIRVNTTNPDTVFFDGYHGRLRPHSHHLIVTMPGTHTDDEAAPWLCGPQVIDRWLFGAQTPAIDVAHLSHGENPQPGDPDYQLAHDLPPNQTLLMDMHYVNVTEEPLLREAWAVLNYVKPENVTTKVDLIGFYNPGISIPPLAHATTSRVTCQVPQDANGQQPVYLGLVTGHAHKRLQRLTLYHTLIDGTEQPIYETRNWSEPGEAAFVTGFENPPMPVQAGNWGAESGYMKVMPGETVSFECEYQNDLDKLVTFGDTTHDEMCNVFGFYYPSVGGQMWNCF